VNLRTTLVALGAVLAGLLVLGALPISAQSTHDWLVTSDGDSGRGTLRWAIEEANESSGGDAIRFASPMTIQLDSPLPPLEDDDIAIVGSDREHSADLPPRVWIDGEHAGDGAGLELRAEGGRVSGLGIVGFERYGIGIVGSDASDAKIEGNWIGLRANGVASANQLSGIAVLAGARGAEIEDNRIGGNSVSGRTGHGIVVGGGGSVDAQIVGNVIGIAADGRAAPNDDGILIVDSAQATIRDNTIGHSRVAGIEVRETRHPISIDGNRIGLRRDGRKAANDIGIYLGPGSSEASVGTNERNFVSGNRVGIAVEQGAREAIIQSNWIGLAPPRGETMLSVEELPQAQVLPNEQRGISVIAGAALVQVKGNYISAGDFGIVVDGDDTNHVSLTENVVAGARNSPTEAAIDVRGGATVNLGGEEDRLGNHVCGAEYGIRIARAEEVTIYSNAVGTGAARRVTFDSDDAMRWGIRLEDGASRAIVQQNYIAEVSQAAISVVGIESEDNNLTRNRYGWNGIDIDLGADGVTDNDPRDRDRGPNGLLNRPVITEHEVRTVSRDVFTTQFSGVATPGSYVEIYVWRSDKWDRIARSQRTSGRGSWTARTGVLPTAPIRALAVTGPGATSEFSDVFLPSQRVRLSEGVVRFAWTGPEMPIGEGLEEIARWVDVAWRWDAALSRWDGWSPRVPSFASSSEFRVRTGDVLHVRLSGRPPRDFFAPAGGTISEPEAIALRAGFNSVAWLGGRVERFDALERLEEASPDIIGHLWQWNGDDWDLIWPRLIGGHSPDHWEFPVFWLRATREGTLGPP